VCAAIAMHHKASSCGVSGPLGHYGETITVISKNNEIVCITVTCVVLCCVVYVQASERECVAEMNVYVWS
jgi:hypothetical protein